ncbi:uncharacterized protein TNCV_1419151 [Trichonephila clavipes]|nr:uncharacterized protein TNCV_1419151 [Trichonephila clavipes]
MKSKSKLFFSLFFVGFSGTSQPGRQRLFRASEELILNVNNADDLTEATKWPGEEEGGRWGKNFHFYFNESSLHENLLEIQAEKIACGRYNRNNGDYSMENIQGIRKEYSVLMKNYCHHSWIIKIIMNCSSEELWFQQDGATCHTARATIDLLKDTFGDRLISRFGMSPVNWPPRSCDLTPLDYFLRGYVKSLVYADKPQTLDHLEDNIRRVIADIRPQMLEKVIENWTSREIGLHPSQPWQSYARNHI